MISVRTSPWLYLGLMAAMLCFGCSQKKAAVAVPQTPSAAPQPTPQPAAEPAQNQQPEASATQGTPPPEPQPETAQSQSTPAGEKTDSAKAKTAKPAHPSGKKASLDNNRNHTRTTVKSDAEPAPATGPISPSLSGAEVAHNQTITDQLLQSTEATLSGIKRQLSPDEQAIVTQIKDYMNQSRVATKANDLTRAYNLALKARLLSDDLAKR
jgi:hypothetical protein